MLGLSYFFFYTYVGLVLIAGVWGAFFNVAFDFRFLFGLDTGSIADPARINLLSQYRFLRALEIGFGLFSIIFARKIFSEKIYNRLFLAIMGLGILARLDSIFIEGWPNNLTLFFIVYEFLGLIIIYTYTRNKIVSNAR